MNLISCNGCGVVLDKNRLHFMDTDYIDENGDNDSNRIWDGGDFVSTIPCPVCKEPVREDGI